MISTSSTQATRKIIFSLILAVLVSMIALPVAAAERTQLKEFWEARNPEEKVKKLQNMGKTMIERRVKALGAAKTKLAATKRIDQATKNEVNVELEANISNLNVLKDEILATEDLAELKTKVRSIAKDYRIYVVILPQTHGLVVTDRLNVYKEKLVELQARLQEKVDEAKEKGIDVTAVQAKIDEAAAKIQEAEDVLATAEEKFASMQVSDPQGARGLKLEGKNALVSARKNLVAAKNSLREAVKELREGITQSSTD